MDDLRLALLIAGIVVVALIYAVARNSRRKAARKRAELDLAAWDSQDGVELDPDEGTWNPPEPTRGGAGADAHVRNLGGVFTPTRETSDAELSVDVSILAGLRATYESTMDGTIEESVRPEPSLEIDAAELTADTDLGTPDTDRGTLDADQGAAEPIAIDMTRPLVYLTLVAKQERVSGRVVLDALGEEGFCPGLMRLFYWRSDAEPSVTFGVANMVEPGVLDPDELPDMETPGLVTFMSVPRDSASAFRILDTMVTVSRRLARRIDATLCDETRSTLTAQAENHLRETVANILRLDRT